MNEGSYEWHRNTKPGKEDSGLPELPARNDRDLGNGFGQPPYSFHGMKNRLADQRLFDNNLQRQSFIRT